MADLSRLFPDPPASGPIRNAAHIRRLKLLEARLPEPAPAAATFPLITRIPRGYAADAARIAREAAEAGFIVKT
jgi:hypothetical protein